MTPLELPIFHHTDSTAQAKELGLDYDIEDTQIRPVTFYHINAVSPYSESLEDINNPQLSAIHSNGTEYICPIPYEKLLAKIDEARLNDRPI